MSPKKLSAIFLLMLVAIGLSVPALTAPSFDEVIRPCMDSEALEPPARRVATCLCYFEKQQSWTFNTGLLLMGGTSRITSKRVVLNECRATAARLI